jgi:hypothetical protein
MTAWYDISGQYFSHKDGSAQPCFKKLTRFEDAASMRYHQSLFRDPLRALHMQELLFLILPANVQHCRQNTAAVFHDPTLERARNIMSNPYALPSPGEPRHHEAR